MIKKILILYFALFTSISFAGQPVDWLVQLENPRYEIFRLKDDNLLENYLKYDFSSLLKPESDFLGFIEPNYRRLKIQFNSVKKNPANNAKYDIKGFSIVKNNKCDFSGTMTLTQVREYKEMHYGVDDEYKEHGIKAQGIAVANYELYENKQQKFSGVFEGVMTLYWYKDKNDNLVFDDIEKSVSDNYKNNQYVGTWKQYNKSKVKIANWGEYRIPYSGGLDIGAGEFGVNPKFYSQGWDEFKQ
jgi:hypothetical protein